MRKNVFVAWIGVSGTGRIYVCWPNVRGIAFLPQLLYNRNTVYLSIHSHPHLIILLFNYNQRKSAFNSFAGNIVTCIEDHYWKNSFLNNLQFSLVK